MPEKAPTYRCEWAGDPRTCREPATGWAGGPKVQHPLCDKHLKVVETMVNPRPMTSREPITAPCQHAQLLVSAGALEEGTVTE